MNLRMTAENVARAKTNRTLPVVPKGESFSRDPQPSARSSILRPRRHVLMGLSIGTNGRSAGAASFREDPMREAITAAMALGILVAGIVIGSVITQRRMEAFLESECDRIDREDERRSMPAMRVASARTPGEPGTFMEAAAWDARGLGELTRGRGGR